ncbi:hypothetical protein [Vibrio sp. F13]|uniref:hypothetical protein n=1 Tax=Vibrio sp. F13 TaxID=2070777 RepID=UPI001F0F3BD9|nr:hypothetical protein [Vibrio sp. F13]
MTELNGQLPQDKETFLRTIEHFMMMSENDQNNFVLGRRMHYYATLSDMRNQLMYDSVQKELDRIKLQNLGNLDDIFYQLRQRMI